MLTGSRPGLVLHGGAGQWANRDPAIVLAGMQEAAEAAWGILRQGGSALDAVERAVILLENNPLFDAGLGSFINDQGEVEMDALIADGEALQFGAVAAVRRVRNPISLARLVMTKTEHCFFVADGADQLAASHGMPLVPNVELITEAEFTHFRNRQRHDPPRTGLGTGTVGAVAVDAKGHTASATSTGGTPDKRKGRVGDTPIFGAGGYAHDRFGAASATGRGENIMRFFLCKHTVDLLAGNMHAQEAAERAIANLSSQIAKPDAGVIIIDRHGGSGASHSTEAMPIAWVNADGEIRTSMRAPGLLT